MSGDKCVIGITGGIATGKTSVLRILGDMGAATLSADEVSRHLMVPGTEMYKQVVARFGQCILLSDSRIDRRALAAVVFADESARKDLNNLTHPAIIGEIRREINTFRKEKCGPRVLAIEIPLLFECGMESIVDTTVVVTSEQDAQIIRLTKRDSLPEGEALVRVGCQMTLAEKTARADYVVENNGSLIDLREKASVLFGIR